MPNEVWIVLGWGATLVATALLVYALFAKRIALLRKTKRRCPKCWYDMSHTEGLQCPECGRTWRRESKLYTFRRRPLAFVVALILFALAVPARRAEEITERGWIACVPTTLLIATLPWSIDLQDEFVLFLEPYESPSAVPAAPTDPSDIFWLNAATELTSRCRTDALRAWQWWLLCEVTLAHVDAVAARAEAPFTRSSYGGARGLLHSAESRDHLAVRHRTMWERVMSVALDVESCWPLDVPLAGRLDLGIWYALSDVRVTIIDDRTNAAVTQFEISADRALPDVISLDRSPHQRWVELGPAPDGLESLTYSITIERRFPDGIWREPVHRELSIAVAGHDTLDDHVTAVRSPELDAVLSSMRVTALSSDPVRSTYDAVSFEVDAGLPAALQACGIDVMALRVELLRGQRRLATTTLCLDPRVLRPPPAWATRTSNARLESPEWPITPLAADDVRPAHEPLRLRITSAPDRAMREPDAVTYWDGDVEVIVERRAHGSGR